MILKAFFFLGLAAIVKCKCFSKCDLAHELSRHGVPHSQLYQWVCMATAESSRCTTATHTNTDSHHSTDYGIFQINSYWNCDPRDGRATRNGCGHPCSDFTDTSLSDDVSCIKTLIGWQGSMDKVSYGYAAHCMHETSAYLHGCNV